MRPAAACKIRQYRFADRTALHQRVGHNADDGSPRLRLAGIEDSDLMTDRALIAPMFPRKTRIHNCDRLFRVDIVDGEIAAFENFQPKRREIIVRDRFEISARPVAIGQIILSVNFVLAASRQMSCESDRSCAADSNWGLARKSRTARLKNSRRRIFGWIGAFHQGHPRGIDRRFHRSRSRASLISDRFDFERRRNQKRCGQSDLPDHEHARDDVDHPTGIPAAAFLHDLRCIAS